MRYDHYDNLSETETGILLPPGVDLGSTNAEPGSTPVGVEGLSRRNFLRGAGKGLAILAGGTGLAAVGVFVVRKPSDVQDQGPSNGLENAFAEATDEDLVDQVNQQLPAPEDAPTLETISSERVSIERVVKYASGAFPTTREEYLQGKNDSWGIHETMLPHEMEAEFATILKRFTGKETSININPSTNELLPDTAKDLPRPQYASKLGSFTGMMSVMPSSLISIPGSYNVLKDHLPHTSVDGRDSVKDVGGTVHGKTQMLSMDKDHLNHLPTYMHELGHVGQFLRPPDEYRALRDYGEERFGGVDQMLIDVENLRRTGKFEDPVVDRVAELIRDEVAEPDPNLEDQAYTLDDIVLYKGELLPESDEPLVQYFRQKQVMAALHLSEVSGVDILAMLEFCSRFGDATHPSTLTDLEDNGVLDHISRQDVSGLADTLDQSSGVKYKTPLEPGLHFVDFGAADRPEYVVFRPDGQNGEGRYGYTLRLAVDSVATPNMAQESTAEQTNSTASQPLSESPEEAEAPEESQQLPFTHKNYILVQTLSEIFPGATEDEITIQGESTESDAPDSRAIFRIHVDPAAIDRLDQERIVGRLNDDHSYEAL